jgi:hypothetical protein
LQSRNQWATQIGGGTGQATLEASNILWPFPNCFFFWQHQQLQTKLEIWITSMQGEYCRAWNTRQRSHCSTPTTRVLVNVTEITDVFWYCA